MDARYTHTHTQKKKKNSASSVPESYGDMRPHFHGCFSMEVK